MNTNKFIVGGIIGGVANFLLGWLVWGMLLMSFMNDHTSEIGKPAMRGEDGMVWWALIGGNLLLGFLLSYILNKSKVTSAGAGAATGFVVGLLMSCAFDFFVYAQLDVFDTTAMAVDIIASTVVSTIIGGIIGWYLGTGKKAVE
jgi:hypothetical protein